MSAELSQLTSKRFLEWQAVADGAEKIKHLLPTQIWEMFFTIRAFFLRIAHVLMRESVKEEMMPWREDPGIHQILSRILPEEEIKASFQLETEALIQIRQNLEARFLQRIRVESEAL